MSLTGSRAHACRANPTDPMKIDKYPPNPDGTTGTSVFARGLRKVRRVSRVVLAPRLMPLGRGDRMSLQFLHLCLRGLWNFEPKIWPINSRSELKLAFRKNSLTRRLLRLWRMPNIWVYKVPIGAVRLDFEPCVQFNFVDEKYWNGFSAPARDHGFYYSCCATVGQPADLHDSGGLRRGACRALRT